MKSDLKKGSVLNISKIIVKYHDQKVGEIMMTPDHKRAVFRYDERWLSEGFSISPLELPLKNDMFMAREDTFRGNFGIFEDSVPDGYGRYLINRILHSQGIDSLELNPLQRLAVIGHGGMGALCYEPEVLKAIDEEFPGLEALQTMALAVLSETDSAGIETLYFNSGNSGGCRPKALYRDDQGQWLVKFRHTYDSPEIGRQEYMYAVAARRCGIVMPDFKLLDDKYFASKRFDIDGNGVRVHVATAAAILAESINPPLTDYKVLLKLTGFLTQDPRQVEQMYRRMVFNVLSQNKDDHAKNFSFICRGGVWTLAPAYDLTYSPQGYNGEHATSVNYNGKPTEKDMLDVASYIHLPKVEAMKIISVIRGVADELLEEVRR